MTQATTETPQFLFHTGADRPPDGSLPQTSLRDAVAVCAEVFLPILAQGVIIRRPWMMAVAERFDLDRRAIRRMERVAGKYGPGPVLIQVPGRSVALILEPEHVDRVLTETPEPFAAATAEKRAALSHFEPENVLISEGAARAERRGYNEKVLDTGHPIHRLGEGFLRVVESEADRLYQRTGVDGRLGWARFSEAWFRIVRRVVFGDAAQEDNGLSVTMAKLRRAANWAFLIPERKELREELLGRIRTYMAQADARSLAGMMAEIPSSSTTAADHQPPQWLFAFDAAGMATFRTLALLASHRGYARQVRNEIEEVSHRSAEPPPYTRAAVMESLRLWPTTPLLLRETRAATVWEAGELPANTLVVIFTPYFHRNRNLPYADVFSPELWMATGAEKRVGAGAALIPFSDGPAMCPGRSLVLFLATAMVAAVLRRMRLRIEQPGLLAGSRLPGTLNHFGIRFQIRPAAA